MYISTTLVSVGLGGGGSGGEQKKSVRIRFGVELYISIAIDART